MTATTKRQLATLQRLINQTVAASNAFNVANSALMDFCHIVYGHEPGDIDADEIIDGIQGGNGVASGMTAEEFDAIMRK